MLSKKQLVLKYKFLTKHESNHSKHYQRTLNKTLTLKLGPKPPHNFITKTPCYCFDKSAYNCPRESTYSLNK